MKPDIVIVGWGPTLDEYRWDDDAAICAVSGAIYHCEKRPDHWVAFDTPNHYHDHKDDPYVKKHVRFGHTAWIGYPNVYGWIPLLNPLPSLEWRIPAYETRLHTGLLFNATSSMLAAVQIMALLDFKRMLFVGCDFLIGYGGMIWRTLLCWKPHFERAGIEWSVASPKSRLAEFCEVRGEPCPA